MFQGPPLYPTMREALLIPLIKHLESPKTHPTIRLVMKFHLLP